jgi:hypothetical protein
MSSRYNNSKEKEKKLASKNLTKCFLIFCLAMLVAVLTRMYFQARQELSLREDLLLKAWGKTIETQKKLAEKGRGTQLGAVNRSPSPPSAATQLGAQGEKGKLASPLETAQRKREVLILTVMNDDRSFGGRRTATDFVNLLASFNYAKERTAIGVLCSDRRLEAHLHDAFSTGDNKYASVQIFYRKLDDAIELGRSDADRHAAFAQKKRRSLLARYRNLLLSLSLSESDRAVLWIDADMVTIPSNIIEMFQQSNKEIVTVHTKRGRETYDLNAWQGPRIKPTAAERERIARGGLFIPRPGPGAKHMDNFNTYASMKNLRGSQNIVPLDSVGGTVLWVQAELHRQGVIFPPLYLIGSEWGQVGGYDGIETEGICYLANAVLGRQACWGMPAIIAQHHES